MGILTRLFQPETKAALSEAQLIDLLRGGTVTASGVSVTPESSLRSTAVFACVRVIAETLASLPLITYQRLPRGKERAPDFYLYPLLHDAPNPEMTSFTFRETLTGHVALWGNGYAEMEIDGAGRVVGLWPLLPNQTRLERNKNGKLVYVTYVPGSGEKGLPAERVMHVRGIGLNGLTGLSVIGLARQAVGLALATEEFGARFFGNGAQPGVVLKHPGKLDDATHDRLKTSWEEAHSGLSNSHRTAILEEGMGIEKIGIPNDDAQFLETRKFQVRDLARLFRIPPHLIGDLEQATFSNIEQQSLEFVIYSMLPWISRWEQEIARSVYLEQDRDRYFSKFLLTGLLRGDTAARYEAYTKAINTGWLTRNEARELEDMNADDPALDKYLMPLNMTTVGTSPSSLEGRTTERELLARWMELEHVHGNGRHE